MTAAVALPLLVTVTPERLVPVVWAWRLPPTLMASESVPEPVPKTIAPRFFKIKSPLTVELPTFNELAFAEATETFPSVEFKMSFVAGRLLVGSLKFTVAAEAVIV